MKIPTFEAKIISKSQCAFYCPACKKMHRHGIEDGHRVAHCFSHGNPNSPFKDTGYILKIVKEDSENEREQEAT